MEEKLCNRQIKALEESLQPGNRGPGVWFTKVRGCKLYICIFFAASITLEVFFFADSLYILKWLGFDPTFRWDWKFVDSRGMPR